MLRSVSPSFFLQHPFRGSSVTITHNNKTTTYLFKHTYSTLLEQQQQKKQQQSTLLKQQQQQKKQQQQQQQKQREKEPQSNKYAVFGLGNIGTMYEGTRHNVGFSCVESLAHDLGVQFKSMEKHHSIVAETTVVVKEKQKQHKRLEEKQQTDGEEKQQENQEKLEKQQQQQQQQQRRRLQSTEVDDDNKTDPPLTITTKTLFLVKPTTFMNLSGNSVNSITKFFKIPLKNILVICDDVELPLGRVQLKVGGGTTQKGIEHITQQQQKGKSFLRLRFGISQPPSNMDRADFVLQKFKNSENSLVKEAQKRVKECILLWLQRGNAIAMNEFNKRK